MIFSQQIRCKFLKGHLITNKPITNVVNEGDMEDSGEFYITCHLQAVKWSEHAKIYIFLKM